MDPTAAWHDIVTALGSTQVERALALVTRCPEVATATGAAGQTLLHVVSNSFHSQPQLQQIIRVLIDAGADIEARDDEGWTPLLTAAGPPLPNLWALETLLELGADASATVQGLSALHLAVYEHSRPGVVAALIAHGLDVNLHDDEGMTPLHLAVCRGLAADVRVLIDHGATLDAVTDEGLTPFGYAQAYAWPEIVAELRERTREEPLAAWRLAEIGLIHQQVERGDPATVAGMLTYQPSLMTMPSELGRWTPMVIASRDGRVDMLEVLLQHGGAIDEVNDAGFNLTYHATYRRQETAKRWLLEHGAAPAHRCRMPTAGSPRFCWDALTVPGSRRFLPGDDGFAHLRHLLQAELPRDYVQFMRRFGSGCVSERLVVFTPERIMADHRRNRDLIESRFPPGACPYENAADVFTAEQVSRIVLAGTVNEADEVGFVSGEAGWWLLPRDGLIEHLGDDLGEMMSWLIRNGTFGTDPGGTDPGVAFTPMAPS